MSDDTPTAKKRRRWKRWLLAGVLVILGLPLVLVGLLQTSWARDRIAAWASTKASDASGYTVTISGLRGIHPADLRVRRITVADDAGTWLTLDDVAAELDLQALRRDRHIRIPSATIGTADWQRLPNPPGPRPESGGGGLPWLDVEAARIDRLVLGEAILGEPVEGAVTAVFAMRDDTLDGQLSLALADDVATVDAAVTVTLAEALEQTQATATITWRESQPVLMQRFGIVSEAGGTIVVTVDGPLATLPVTLSVVADDVQVIASSATLQLLAESPAIDLQGVVNPARLPLPEAVAARVVGEVAVAINGHRQPDGRIVIAALDLRDEATSVTGSGHFEPSDQSVQATAVIVVNSLPALRLPIDLQASGPLTLSVEAAGSTEALDATLRLSGDGLSYDDWQVTTPELQATVQTRDMDWRGDGLPTARGTVALRAARITGPDSQLPQAMETVAISGDVAITPETVASESLSLAVDGLTILARDLTWTAATNTLAATVQVKAAEIATFNALAGRDLGGAVEITAAATVALETRAVTAKGTASWQVPMVDTRDLSVYLGPSLSSTFDIAWDPATDALVVTDTTLTGELGGGTVTLSGKPTAKVARTTFELTHRDLSVLPVPESLGLAGQGRVAGTFDLSPEVASGRYTWRAESLVVDGWSADETSGSGTLRVLTPYADAIGELQVAVEGAVKGVAGRTIPELPVRDATVALSLARAKDGRITVESARLADGELAATGSGHYDPASGAMDLAVKLQVPELERFAELSGAAMAGAATIEATVTGTAASPVIAGTVASASVVVEGQTITDLELALSMEREDEAMTGDLDVSGTWREWPLRVATDWRYDRQRVRLKDLAIAGPGSSVTGHLELDLDAMAATGTLRGTSESLDTWQSLIPVQVSGAAELAILLSLKNHVQVAAVDATLRDGSVADITVAEGRVVGEIRDLLGPATATATLTVKSATRGETTVEALALELSTEGRAQTFKLTANGTHLAREFRIAEATGVLAWPELRLATLSGEVFGYPVALREPASLAWETGIVLAPTLLRIGPGELSAAMSLVDEALVLDLKSADVPLGALPGVDPKAITGTVAATVALRGTLAAPTGRIDLRVKDLQLLGKGDYVLFTGGGDVNAQLRADGVTVAAALYESDYQPLSMEGELPLRVSLVPFALDLPRDGALRMEADVDLNLETPARYLLPDGHDLRGHLRGHLMVTGSLAEPVMAGQLRLDEGSYENVFTGTVLTAIGLRLAGSGNRLEVKELTASDGDDGRIVGSGHWLFDPAANFPYAASVKLERFTAVRFDHTTAETQGTIAVKGDLNEIAVTGTLEVTDAEVRMPESRERVVHVDVIETRDGVPIETEEADEETAGAMPVSLDVKAGSRGRIFLRGNGVDSEWRGDLVVKGDAAKPAITGELELVRGTYTFGGRRFKLVEGSLRFDGAAPPDPTLRLVAETIADGMVVQITISGPSSAPKLAITSRPSLPTDEILARLFFRRGAGQISPYQAITLAALAEKMTTGGDAFDVASQLRRLTSLDQIDMAPGEQPGEAGSVSAGKYLGDRFYLEYTKSLEDDEDRLSVEIELRRNLGVETDISPTGTAGIGIFWRRDY